MTSRFITSILLVSFGVTTLFAQTPAVPPQGATPPPATERPAAAPAGGQPLPEAAQLAVNRALTALLEERAAEIEGPAVDENGAPFGTTVKLGLVLIQAGTVQQFQQAQVKLQGLKDASREEKLAEIERLRALAPPAATAYQHMTHLDGNIMQGDLKGEHKNLWESIMREADDLEMKGNKEAADARRKDAAQTVWGQYLAARMQFYMALGTHPLLGVRLPGTWRQLWVMDSPYFFFRLMQTPDNNDAIVLLNEHIDMLLGQLKEQETRVANMKTWSELYGLASPAFGQTQAATATSTGPLGTDLVTAATATNAGSRAVAAYENAFTDTALSVIQVGSMLIPVAGPFLSAGITGIQVYKSGDEYVIALTEESNATAGAAVTGYEAVSAASDKTAAAGSKFLVSIALAPAEIPALVGALKTGKVLVQRGASFFRTGGPVATDALAATANVERGMEKIRKLGLPESELKSAENTYQNAQKPYKDDDVGGGQYRNYNLIVRSARQEIAAVDNVDNLIADARAAGVPEADIQAMLARARTTNTLTAYTHTLSQELATATANQRGVIFVVDPTAVQAFRDVVGDGLIKPANVIVTDVRVLEDIRTKLSFMREGRLVTWTPEQMGILDKLTAWAGGDPTKMTRFVSDQGAFLPLFGADHLEVATKFLTSADRAALAAGKIPFGGLRPSVLVEPNGAWIKPEVAAKLSTQQILDIPLDFIKQMDATEPLTQVLLKRLAETQGTAAAWARDALAAASAAKGVNSAAQTTPTSQPPTPGTRSASGSPVLTSTQVGSVPAGLTPELEKEAAAKMAAWLAAGPDGLTLTPPGGPTYPMQFAPDGSVIVLPPGSSTNWTTFGDPLFTAPPTPFEPSRVLGGPGGTLFFDMPFQGLGVDSVPSPSDPTQRFNFTPFNFNRFPGPEYGGAGERLPFTPAPAPAPNTVKTPTSTGMGTLPGSGTTCAPGMNCIDLNACITTACSNGFLPSSAGDREGTVQAMIIEVIFVRSTNTAQRAVDAPPTLASIGRAVQQALLGFFVRPDVLAMRGSSPSAVARTLPRGGNAFAQSPGTGARGAVQTVLTSLGTSTGEAFQIQVLGDGPFQLGASGLVVEPLKKAVQQEVRNQLTNLASKNPVTANLNGYCLEFLRQPPSAGTLFRIASPELQRRFAPLRNVLQTAQKLQQAGLLKPDGNPETYFQSIRQWAIWTKEQNFSREGFQRAFIEHAKKNFTAARRQWTNQIEDAVRGVVPHRWEDITLILQEAAKTQ